MAEYPAVCILRVNFQSSQSAKSIKEKLLKISGVEYVSVNRKLGLVKVRGNIDSVILLRTLKDMGRKAEICSDTTRPQESVTIVSNGDVITHEYSHSKRINNKVTKRKSGWKRWFYRDNDEDHGKSKASSEMN